jgi:hypothetical protein
VPSTSGCAHWERAFGAVQDFLPVTGGGFSIDDELQFCRCYRRVFRSSDRNGESTPDRSKLCGSHGQRPLYQQLIIRSEVLLAKSQAVALQRRLDKGEVALRGLTPGPGQTQFVTGWELEWAAAAVLAEHQVEGRWR